MPAKNFGGTSTSGNHDPTFLAHPSLVTTTVEDVNCNPISVAKAGGPTFTNAFSSNTTALKEEVDYAGMSPVWQSIQAKGISEAAAKLIMEQRNTVPTLQRSKRFVIRGKSVTFSHLQCRCSTSLPCYTSKILHTVPSIQPEVLCPATLL